MPQSLAKNLIHLVFSTKNREPLLADGVRPQLHEYLGGILNDLDSAPIAIGLVRDHAHILFVLTKNRALADEVMEVKRGSSKWLKTQGARYQAFHWQNGYGAFSVSPSSMAEVEQYIAHQAEHHRVKTFQEEYREFLERHHVAYEERYVWD